MANLIVRTLYADSQWDNPSVPPNGTFQNTQGYQEWGQVFLPNPFLTHSPFSVCLAAWLASVAKPGLLPPSCQWNSHFMGLIAFLTTGPQSQWPGPFKIFESQWIGIDCLFIPSQKALGYLGKLPTLNPIILHVQGSIVFLTDRKTKNKKQKQVKFQPAGYISA